MTNFYGRVGAMINRVKVELIDDWRLFWRFWSVRLGIIGTALTGVLVAFPDAALYAWNLLPSDLKAAIPEQYVPLIGVGVFVLSLVARLIKQQRPEPKGVTDNATDGTKNPN
ncbi:holin [Escherichia phage Shy]|nr:holin [Escherichia phage Shy]